MKFITYLTHTLAYDTLVETFLYMTIHQATIIIENFFFTTAMYHDLLIPVFLF